ncbi:MAG: RNA-binding protein [Nitrospirota bacterium]
MKKIYVGNIAVTATEQDVKDLFAEYGEIVSVKLKQSKGFGFVEMGSDDEAREAISELNGKEFLGKALTVTEAIPRQPRAAFHEKKGGFGKGKVFKKAW